jgi:hypothetical protein
VALEQLSTTPTNLNKRTGEFNNLVRRNTFMKWKRDIGVERRAGGDDLIEIGKKAPGVRLCL